ncbi:hypothetical protein H2201_005180 [Coniosporium apollinis]|uniref:Uncharacterized protein n=1 Tax=Coniosporium apollinis TaxID=61459 RepID=A0ABQ9NTU3_9PEZI|nr:hypothetical protein H2201_005180 [Coniosporium apollinis]
MVDSYPQYGQLHRKPIPGTASIPRQFAASQQQSAHSHTRTSSSNVLPTGTPIYQAYHAYQPAPSQSTSATRRTLSNATASTTSTNRSSGAGMIPVRTNSTASGGLRRSSSGRSMQPTSYVALMRKQKATVWCDRAQTEDPRLLAAQRAAKMRAAMEVVGGNQSGRTSTSSSGMVAGVGRKIRHHGAQKAERYAPGANLSGTGVPMRLSASEVDDGASDDGDSAYTGRPYHRRTGSDRSSLGSGRRVTSHGQPLGGRYSTNSTPPSGQGSSPSDTMAELAEETPVPGDYRQRGHDYFTQSTTTGLSGGSGSSGERESSFGQLGQMQPHQNRMNDDRSITDELRRRGSVDDRTHTMSGAVRLFVANPDHSDSD